MMCQSEAVTKAKKEAIRKAVGIGDIKIRMIGSHNFEATLGKVFFGFKNTAVRYWVTTDAEYDEDVERGFISLTQPMKEAGGYLVIARDIDEDEDEVMELTARQAETLDEIDNDTYAYISALGKLAEVEVEWDMELIGEVKDMVIDFLRSKDIPVPHPYIGEPNE